MPNINYIRTIVQIKRTSASRKYPVMRPLIELQFHKNPEVIDSVETANLGAEYDQNERKEI